MDELTTASPALKAEAFVSNQCIKVESMEAFTMEERKFSMADSSARNGLQSNNGIAVAPTNLISLPMSTAPSSVQTTVVAQIAPMSQAARNLIEPVHHGVGSVPALLLNKSTASAIANNPEPELRENAASGASPITVTVVPSTESISPSVSSGTSVGGGRSNSNPDHIKRPMNAFLIWSTARRHKIKMDEPNITMAEISKRLGEEWKNMGPEDRQPYVEQSKLLRAEHMAKYPDYKYQPRRRKSQGNHPGFPQNPGRIKSIKSSPAAYSPTSTTGEAHFQQAQPPLQQTQQTLQQAPPPLQRGQQNQTVQAISAHGESQQLIFTQPNILNQLHQQQQQLQHQQQQQLQQQRQQQSHQPVQPQQQQPPPQQSQAVIIPHQSLAVNSSSTTSAPQQQQQQQQQLLNGSIISAAAASQWPNSIYPGLSLVGYQMTSNGILPLYSPTHPPLILPTGSVSTVLQPATASVTPTTATVTVQQLQQQQQQLQLQQQQQQPQQHQPQQHHHHHHHQQQPHHQPPQSQASQLDERPPQPQAPIVALAVADGGRLVTAASDMIKTDPVSPPKPAAQELPNAEAEGGDKDPGDSAPRRAVIAFDHM